jgi:hypothetical protein
VCCLDNTDETHASCLLVREDRVWNEKHMDVKGKNRKKGRDMYLPSQSKVTKVWVRVPNFPVVGFGFLHIFLNIRLLYFKI